MSVIIAISADVGGFAEDKDRAKRLRVESLLPALEKGEEAILDFAGVQYATQSFVHALVGEPLKKFGEPVLHRIEFKNCSPQLRTVIELVVDYSLGGFEFEPSSGQPAAAQRLNGKQRSSGADKGPAVVSKTGPRAGAAGAETVASRRRQGAKKHR